MMAKRAARQKNQLPPCYYEGFLEKRSDKDKTSRKLWTCLCGNKLFFFNDKKDTDYIETLDLSGLISITDDSSQDRNLGAARLNLQMKDGNIKFTVPSAEARELWKGFIRSVTELSVPAFLNLLPGQIHMLREAVEQEKERIKTAPPPAPNTSFSPYISLQADMPACYHNVSRLEAVLLLEREATRGNMLLRPGSSGNTFAVTTRQDLDGSVFKHYLVTRKHEGGFIIDVDIPVPCATLHEVINYLVEKTEGVLIPLIMEEPYEKNISFIRSDNENGERSVQQASSNPVPPDVPPKPVSIRIQIPEPTVPVSLEEEPIYLNDKLEMEKKTEDLPAVPQSILDKSTKKKAMMPPIPVPRKCTTSISVPSSTSSTSDPSSSSSTFAPSSASSTAIPSSSSSTAAPSSASTHTVEMRMRASSESLGQIPQATLSELKLKLEQKARCQE